MKEYLKNNQINVPAQCTVNCLLCGKHIPYKQKKHVYLSAHQITQMFLDYNILIASNHRYCDQHPNCDLPLLATIQTTPLTQTTHPFSAYHRTLQILNYYMSRTQKSNENMFQDCQNHPCDNIHNKNRFSSDCCSNPHSTSTNTHRNENSYSNTALAGISSITNITNLQNTLSPNNISFNNPTKLPSNVNPISNENSNITCITNIIPVHNSIGADLYATTLAPQDNVVSNAPIATTCSINNSASNSQRNVNRKRRFSDREPSPNDSTLEPSSKKHKPSVPVINAIENSSEDTDTVFISFENSSNKRVRQFSRLTKDIIRQLAREHNVPENELFILYTRLFRHVPYTFADPIFDVGISWQSRHYTKLIDILCSKLVEEELGETAWTREKINHNTPMHMKQMFGVDDDHILLIADGSKVQVQKSGKYSIQREDYYKKKDGNYLTWMPIICGNGKYLLDVGPFHGNSDNNDETIYKLMTDIDYLRDSLWDQLFNKVLFSQNNVTQSIF